MGRERIFTYIDPIKNQPILGLYIQHTSPMDPMGFRLWEGIFRGEV